jgi:hypothetical protein
MHVKLRDDTFLLLAQTACSNWERSAMHGKIMLDVVIKCCRMACGCVANWLACNTSPAGT